MVEKDLKIPSWAEFVEKVQPGRQVKEDDDSSPEAKPKLEKEEAVQETKRKFLGGMKQKLTAMALAGFVTLGGGWEKSLADQLKIKLPEKEGAAPEFTLETAITAEKLTRFKEKIRREEPGFARWTERYIESLKQQLDKLVDEILNYDLQSQSDLEKEKNLQQILWRPEMENHADNLIEKGHEVITKLKKKPEVLRNHSEFLKSNLDTIVWGIIFMADSERVRNNQIRLVFPPEIVLSIHDFEESNDLAAHVNFNRGIFTGKYTPRIKILPGTFELDQKQEPSLNYFVNIMIHELVHALNPNSINRSSLYKKLIEGIAQNIAFEVVQHLGTQNENIKPIVSLLKYDIRLIVAAILESVFRSQQYGEDTLAEWHAGTINNDNYMLNRLGTALEILNLDATIAQDIGSINSADPRKGELWLFKEILIDMLARLKITNVNLSPEFLRAIIASNRKLDDWQIRRFEETIELGAIETRIKDRADRLKPKPLSKNARH